MKYISFEVSGIPVPKGSASAFPHAKTGKIIVIQSNRAKQKPWASLIGLTAQTNFKEPVIGPIELRLHFQMPRPKNHFRSNGDLKLSAPVVHIKTPDLDKLIRCVLDALTGIVYFDDKQVCMLNDCTKFYGPHPGVWISVGYEENL